MATQDQMKDEQDNYGLAFDEADAPVAEMSEDEAFGLTPDSEEPSGDSGEGSAPAESIEIGSPEQVPVEAEAPTDEADPASLEAAPSEDFEQKYKSLQGKYNAETSRLREMLAAKSESGESVAEDAGESMADEDAEGEITHEQAVATLTQDFGEDFVKMIEAIARGAGQEATKASMIDVERAFDEIIGDMNDSKQRAHFEKIHSAHPDFMEVAESPAFTAWVSQNPDMATVIESGSAPEVIALLEKFKADQAAPQEGEESEAMDDAEGVRSTGLRLPEAPQQTKDFKDAWDQF